MQVFKPADIPRLGGIYKFTFDSGYFYIGSSGDLYKRIWAHENIIIANRQKAMNRFVKKAVSISSSVTFEILKIVPNDIDRKNQKESFLSKSANDKNCLNYMERVFAYPSDKPKQVSASVKQTTVDAINDIRLNTPALLSEIFGGLPLSFSEAVDLLLASHPLVEVILKRDEATQKLIKTKK